MKVAALCALFVVGLATLGFARKDETLPELVARAEAARPDQQADLFMEAAERQRKAAGEALKADRADDFRASLQDILKYCDRAHTVALASGKHTKNTEIRIRRISNYLKDIKLDADPGNQPAVQETIDQLEQFRTELLRNMFGEKKHD
jgi:hypothetical protein